MSQKAELTDNQFKGSRNNLPNKLPTGSIYVAIDTKEFFIYGQDELAVQIKSDADLVVGVAVADVNTTTIAVITVPTTFAEVKIEVDAVSVEVEAKIDAVELGLNDLLASLRTAGIITT